MSLDVGARKFLSEKGKKCLHKSFKKWDLEHFQLDEDFDDYLDSDGLKDIIGHEGMQDPNMTSLVSIKGSKKLLLYYYTIFPNVKLAK